jgi:periplasmic mercuric ion binding protein
MKQLFLHLFALLSILGLNACSTNTLEGPDKICSLQIEGMMCEKGCKSTVENKLSKMEGVAEAKVDFETGVALVKFHSDVVNCADMINMIGKIAGGKYSATLIEESELGITAPENMNSGETNEASVDYFRFEVPDISSLLKYIF